MPSGIQRVRSILASAAILRAPARSWPPVVAIVGAVALGPHGAAARPVPHAGPPAVEDTVATAEEVLEEARDRQDDFERHRRLRLPHGAGRPVERCDEIVGRYCLWHGDGPDDRDPPEESESVREARARLLDHLARAQQTVPGSDWLVGQRVRYLLEAERPERALRAARDCEATGWWCRALEGRVLHEEARFVEAREAFAAGLAGMAPRLRRRWTDLSVLLEGEASDRWDDLDHAGRRRMARRAWRLADPLYLVPGNDRRTEHLARRVAVRIRREAATPFGRFWNEGLEELTLRYGLPVEYRREAPSPARPTARPSVLGRHAPDALRFLPPSEVLVRPGRAEADAWRLDAPRPQASYAPVYADTVARLRHRLAVFPRGDTCTVVAAYRADRPRKREPQGGGTEALLRLLPLPMLDSSVVSAVSERRAAGPRGALAVRVPAGDHLLSAEVLRRGDSVAARARYAVALDRRPEGVPGLSDVLVLRADGPIPGTVREALPRVRGPEPVPPGARVDLYWELYGPRLLLDDVEMSVAIAEEDGGWLERLAGAVGLAEGEGVALGWRDAAGRPGRVHPSGIEFRLPDDLPDGDYRLEVSARIPGYDRMSVTRRLTVSEEAGHEE